jgi:site-specific DNA-methyltransferase (adenine-specific)
MVFTDEKDIELWLGDCLIEMDKIFDSSINLVFADLPYKMTKCSWDSLIYFPELWKQLIRVGSKNCVYCFTSNQPFTSYLVQSNLELYRYEIVWEKTRNSHPFFANKRPLPQHETIQIFSKSKIQTYNPQKVLSEKSYTINKNTAGRTDGEKGKKKWKGESVKSNERFPHSVVRKSNPSLEVGLHPTQKPISILDWLIRTYSNEGDIVLDPCFGSCTSGVAAKQLNRKFIGIEKEQKYYDLAVNRIMNETVWGSSL